MISIVANGVLSKSTGEFRGISIQSHGWGLNGNSCISVATHAVLDANCYSGRDLGVIIDPQGLKFFQRVGLEQIPFERQIYDEIPPKNIVGITIPVQYLRKNFLDSELFSVWSPDLLKTGMESLDAFFIKTLNISLLADAKFKEIYDQVLALEAEAELKQRQILFNTTLMARIKKIHSEIFNDKEFTLVDILRHHIGEELPIYFTTGELVTEITVKIREEEENLKAEELKIKTKLAEEASKKQIEVIEKIIDFDRAFSRSSQRHGTERSSHFIAMYDRRERDQSQKNHISLLDFNPRLPILLENGDG